MAKCKYCHEPITRLDKDVCPFCGGYKPLEGTDTSTQDVTKVVGQLGSNVILKQKKKLVAALLAVFLGFLGIHELYLGKIKLCLIFLIFSIVFIGGIGSVLFFFALKGLALAYILPAIVVELVNVAAAVRFYTKHDLVDANGDFLK